ncbi:hypothetical protein S7711_04828 [Stachybotrys chartarum IBT 7711]|uniref:JmjC domain-containing protein n=1 Tax=Stachybotrys chartarum (strain CBS 109288 / IBT 7711) TaxID=1280523 RepID=A0A084AMH1_STACB|nr:hypothetical protein S7711_04828 [Stachybotrys chartarum IBT 7711]KFA78461.1 hypothetical protein S40288_06906 [Stachybotrys chartarum IBT 40288]
MAAVVGQGDSQRATFSLRKSESMGKQDSSFIPGLSNPHGHSSALKSEFATSAPFATDTTRRSRSSSNSRGSPVKETKPSFKQHPELLSSNSSPRRAEGGRASGEMSGPPPVPGGDLPVPLPGPDAPNQAHLPSVLPALRPAHLAVLDERSSGISSPLSSPTSLHDGGIRSDIAFDYDGPDEHRLLRLKPTASQWRDFASILSFARHHGAESDGCFKAVIPLELLPGALPERSSEKAPANAYKIQQIKRNGFWRVSTVPSEGTFAASREPESSDVLEPVDVEIKRLKKIFNKNKDKQLRSVRYRVDIPAWTPKQRELAGVPMDSPIHPLKGDKLDQTKAIIPGIHTPYVYESASYFGATFQIHAEDFRLASLNHLYKGRKIWIVIPCTAVDVAEEALGRKKKCSQFMRHRAEFFFPEKLEKLGIPYRIVDQRPGETIVILPDAYHEGFSTGYTIAEAKNYAESDWSIEKYQACDHSCQLVTAIPAEYMRLLRDGEQRLDLCARYGEDELDHSPKRHRDETDDGEETENEPLSKRSRD